MADNSMEYEFEVLGAKIERRIKMIEGTLEKLETRVVALEKKTQALK